MLLLSFYIQLFFLFFSVRTVYKMQAFIVIILFWIIFEFLLSSFYFSLSGKRFATSPLKAQQTLDYVAGRHSNLPRDYNTREIKHLQDVKRLIKRLRIVMLVLLILFKFVFNFEIPSRIIIVSAIALFVLTLVFFYRVFTIFHKVFFQDGTWTFDHQTEILSRVFPLAFWRHYFLAFPVFVIVSLIVSNLLIS